MAIEFTEGMTTCEDCACGPDLPITQDSLKMLNQGVSYMLGHDKTPGIDQMPIGAFSCAAVIASGMCPKYNPEEHNFPPEVCRTSGNLLAIAARNNAKAAKNAALQLEAWSGSIRLRRKD